MNPNPPKSVTKIEGDIEKFVQIGQVVGQVTIGVEKTAEATPRLSQGEKLKKLGDFIRDKFNLDEISQLCLRFGEAVYEDLPGGRTAKSEGLVKWCERHGKLPLLIELVQDLRPKDWADLVSGFANPYPVLDAFTEKDNELFEFLGRSSDLDGVVKKIQAGTGNIIVLRGESGVGKTSFLRAGLIPRLKHLQPGLELRRLECDNSLLREFETYSASEFTDAKLFILDQFERIYIELDEAERVRFLIQLADLIEQTPSRFLISIREDFFGRLSGLINDEGRRLLKGGVKYEDYIFSRLSAQLAKETIIRLAFQSWVILEENVADKLLNDLIVTGVNVAGSLCSAEEQKPYMPLVLAVCHRLYEKAVIEKKLTRITLNDYDSSFAENALFGYVDSTIRHEPLLTKSSDDALAMLRLLVDERGQRRPDSVEHLRDELDLTVDSANAIIQALIKCKLLVPPNNEGHVILVHDFLAKVVFEHYSNQWIRLRDAINSLANPLGPIFTADMALADIEKNAATQCRQFVRNNLALYQKMPPGVQNKAAGLLVDKLFAKRPKRDGLADELLKDQETAKVFLLVEYIGQLLLIFDAEVALSELLARFESTGGNPAKLAPEFKISSTESSSTEIAAKLSVYWRAVPDRLMDDLPSAQTLVEILKLAQEKTRLSIYGLKEQLRVGIGSDKKPVSRFTLWRALLRLWLDKQTWDPAPDKLQQGKVAELFVFDWALNPTRDYLRKQNALADLRTHQGLLIHIPAGEHAMRNQRVAHDLLIRTVAIERRDRGISPGMHEADDRKLIDSYDDAEISQVLREVIQDYTFLLNQPRKKACVVLEAQEYSIDRMVKLCQELEIELKNKDVRFLGSIECDPRSEIANRKDLTRALATSVDVDFPQPDYCVITNKALLQDQAWASLWQERIEAHGHLVLLDDDTPAACIKALQHAAERLGGNVLVKPTITEFLKGATFFNLATDALATTAHKVWQRARSHGIRYPSLLVEKRIENISRELLVILARDRDGRYISVPPIWYNCRSDLPMAQDRDIPAAFSHAWVTDNLSQADHSLYCEAVKLSQTLAEKLDQETNAKSGYRGACGFLELEWLVASDNRLFLNEVKPTQLDKGVISNYAFDYSDSDLFVRSLFGLPLPFAIALTIPKDHVMLCGALLAMDADAIRQGKKLISYSGIEQALDNEVRVIIYADKMRSVPYLGRRMGVVILQADTLSAAEEKFRHVSEEMLIAQYE